MPCSLSVASVITARVPSLPMRRRVRSYPAELFLALEPVTMTVPSESTAVRLSTFSLILPYRTAVDPLKTQMGKESANQSDRH